jgi:hypothetical protein
MLWENSPYRLLHAHTEIQVSTIEKADYDGTVNLVSPSLVNVKGFGMVHIGMLHGLGIYHR